VLPGARGAIVRDADWPVAVDDAAIERWRAHGEALAGGRGSAWRVRCEGQPAALRHYRRGGLLGGLLGDRYLWTGLERTRPYREFLLTARLHARGLPVPRPLAARIQRSGPYYRGDLLTGWLPDSRTLDLRLRAQSMRAADLARVGAAIAAFHDAGLDHADLNANNILLDDIGQVYVIDFDRGRLGTPSLRIAERNMARLRRSLVKLGHLPAAGDAPLWNHMQEAWRQALKLRVR
jgi:3-deoxy-D-manno-octulosonic acid kinase